jgi:hypothetical protein
MRSSARERNDRFRRTSCAASTPPDSHLHCHRRLHSRFCLGARRSTRNGNSPSAPHAPRSLVDTVKLHIDSQCKPLPHYIQPACIQHPGKNRRVDDRVCSICRSAFSNRMGFIFFPDLYRTRPWNRLIRRRLRRVRLHPGRLASEPLLYVVRKKECRYADRMGRSLPRIYSAEAHGDCKYRALQRPLLRSRLRPCLRITKIPFRVSRLISSDRRGHGGSALHACRLGRRRLLPPELGTRDPACPTKPWRSRKPETLSPPAHHFPQHTPNKQGVVNQIPSP